MKYLLQNGESEARLSLLLSLTNIRSEPTIQALRDHLQKDLRGLDEARAAALNGIELSNFSRAFKALNDVAAVVEKIKELDWRHLKSVK